MELCPLSLRLPRGTAVRNTHRRGAPGGGQEAGAGDPSSFAVRRGCPGRGVAPVEMSHWGSPPRTPTSASPGCSWPTTGGMDSEPHPRPAAVPARLRRRRRPLLADAPALAAGARRIGRAPRRLRAVRAVNRAAGQRGSDATALAVVLFLV